MFFFNVFRESLQFMILKIIEISYCSGALDDFDAANSTKSTDKDVDTADVKLSAEIWNEEFIG